MAFFVLLPATAPAIIVSGQLMDRALGTVTKQFFYCAKHLNLREKMVFSVWGTASGWLKNPTYYIFIIFWIYYKGGVVKLLMKKNPFIAKNRLPLTGNRAMDFLL